MGAFLLLLAAPWARGEDPRPGPPVEPTDDSPTPFACSAETLLSGAQCTLEFVPAKATDTAAMAEKNIRLVSALGLRLCPKVSRLRDEEKADSDLQKYCAARFETAAAANCTLEGGGVVLDGAGNFAVGSFACYSALAQVLSRTRTMAALTFRCCRCAAKACKLTQTQCNDRMVRGAASDATAECARTQCADECETTPGLAARLPPPPSDAPRTMFEPPRPYERPGYRDYWDRRDSVWPWY